MPLNDMTPGTGHKSVHALATGRQKWLGHLAMLVFASLIAGSFSLGHLAAPYVPPTALNALRFVLGTLLTAAVVIVVYRRLPALPVAPWRFLILGGLYAIYFVLMFVALRLSSPVSTGAVFTLTPLMGAGFGWLFLRQHIRAINMVGLIVAAAGAVWVIFRGDARALLSMQLGIGEGIFLVGCAAYAAYSPLVKKLNRGEPALLFTMMTLAAATIWTTAIGARDIVATDWSALPPIVWLVVAYLVIFTTATTNFLFQFASLRLPASKVLAYGYLTPSFVILIEGLLGHGWVNASVALGAVVSGIALLVVVLAPDS